MKKTLVVAGLFTLLFEVHAQIDFQKGYFVNNSNERTECLIKNVDWATNPSRFKYKLNDISEVLDGDISTIKEFSVADLRYVRATVDIDQSPRDVKKMDNNRFPVWKNETVFLKELVHGKGMLYHYQSGEIERFFFAVDENPIKQLVFKEYIASTNQGSYTTYRGVQLVRVNGTYMSQLDKEVSCGPKPKKPRQLKFTKTNLINHFINFNICNGESPTVSDKHHGKTTVHLKITPGVDQGQLELRGNGFGGINTFDSKLNGRIGAEIEIVLPANRNKWAIIFEPTFQAYSVSEKNVSYKSLEVPIGLRHYFYLNTSSRIHLNAGAVVDQPFQYTVKISKQTVKSTTPRLNGFVGIGYDYKRFSIEARYYTKRTGLADDVSYFMDYRKSSVIFGYRIF
jgi:hypothetical protein